MKAIRRSMRSLVIGSALVLSSAVVLAQEEGEGIERDAGFSHNDYSYSSDYRGPGRLGERAVYYGDGFCEICEIHRYDGLGLMYRGSSLDMAFERTRSRQPGHLFEVVDDAGNPLAAVTVTLSRAGFETRAEGTTNQRGQTFVRLTHAKQTHRVLLQAPGRRSLVYELTGGALSRTHHRVVLPSGSSPKPLRQRFLPEERMAPIREATRAFRSAVRLRQAGRPDKAVARFQEAIDLWPVAGGRAGKLEYTPYLELSTLLREQGREADALAVAKRGLEPGHVRSSTLQAQLRSTVDELGSR